MRTLKPRDALDHQFLFFLVVVRDYEVRVVGFALKELRELETANDALLRSRRKRERSVLVNQRMHSQHLFALYFFNILDFPWHQQDYIPERVDQLRLISEVALEIIECY